MKPRPFPIGRALARLLPPLALLLGACHTGYEEIETGYRGEARANPYLAAERLLASEGWRVRDATALAAVAERRENLIVVARSVLDDTPARQLLEAQVRRGTHLLILAEGGESWRNDWSLRPQPEQDAPDGGQEAGASPQSPGTLPGFAPNPPDDSAVPAWLRQFGLLLEHEPRAHPPSAGLLGEELRLDQPGDSAVHLADSAARHPGAFASSGAPVVASVPVGGGGRITLLAHARPLRNRHLAEGDHAELLLLLAAQSNGRTALFLNQNKVSLFALLWRHGWPAILAGGVALLLFLWARMPRRLPIVQVREAGDLATFNDQIVGTGNYLWQHGDGGTLLAALRRRVVRRWRELHPGRVTATAPDRLEPAELESLGRRTQAEPAALAALLGAPAPARPGELEAQVRQLQHLLAALH